MAASLLCLPLGLEREARDKSAGMQTHMLVSIAVAGAAGLAWSCCSSLPYRSPCQGQGPRMTAASGSGHTELA
ncbi:MAG: MgtC/SapB family protein [Proteobacteria bacterium]|nr:MgtC/SapB family protein [Pseudomonadota bacterium]